MIHSVLIRALPSAVVALVLVGCSPGGDAFQGGTGAQHEDLVVLFEEWREFQRPEFVDGVPDYTPSAMAAQYRELSAYQGRLAAIDTTGWSISEQVDYHVVRAEMNGLEFDHRVMRPWARNPAFYSVIHASQSDVPAHEGPIVAGWIDLWTYDYPLTSEAAARLGVRLRTIEPLLEQAKGNLVEDARDLWLGGIRSMSGQIRDLDALSETVATDSELQGDIEVAVAAIEEFRAWLEQEVPSRTDPSGVGVENYDWYLKNVHLIPYTWEEEVDVMRRELARSLSALRLEEHRNRDLPRQQRVSSAAEYDRRFNAAVTEYIRFLRDNEVVTVYDYMEPALRERIGRFTPADGLRGFFSEVSYRDPLVMRTHGHHWFDLAMMAEDPHSSPIRRVPLLYNIWDSRAEGIATGMEEWMMNAGLFADEPRSRELIYILVAQRAARALAGLFMHSNELTMDQAVEFASKWTPRGWLPADGSTVLGEQHLYLQQPYYGASYLMGKYEMEQFMAERASQLGDEFTLKRFMDEVNASGLIPVSLIRWEVTGQGDQIIAMTR
jgi:hypothetical protein